MFDTKVAAPGADPAAPFAGLDDWALTAAITVAAREQSMACARELAAIGELYKRRAPEDDVERVNWAIDGHENVVAEVSAALGISRGRARARLGYAITLRERLPQVAQVFARGDIDFRMMAAIVYRTELVSDAELVATIDACIARHAHKWKRFSQPKLAERIDMWITRFDPAGRRVPGNGVDERYVEINPVESGMAGVWAQLHATDGAALDQKLDAVAATVCRDDPRTARQRRADALGALAAGAEVLRCECGSPQCPAAQRRTGTDVVIHVVADQKSLGTGAAKPGYLPGYGPIPVPVLQQLARRATIKPVPSPATEPEKGYRPSAALTEFVRLRDLTCRFPGCEAPATACQIDHTVPWPLGPTHASNCKLLCVVHHLLKTFYTGAGGWSDRQLPDGTVIWTAPSGATHRTKPHGALFFPALATPTAPLCLPAVPAPRPGRTTMMPARKRTRAQQHRARIAHERRLNEDRLAAERRERHAWLVANDEPPPF